MPSTERQSGGSATGAAAVTAAVGFCAAEMAASGSPAEGKKPVLLRIVVDPLSLTPLLFLLPLIVPPAVNPLPEVLPHSLLWLLFALAAASSDASQLSFDSYAGPADQ